VGAELFHAVKQTDRHDERALELLTFVHSVLMCSDVFQLPFTVDVDYIPTQTYEERSSNLSSDMGQWLPKY
jgi:hypothetical protein